jgi:hypothetical protein
MGRYRMSITCDDGVRIDDAVFEAKDDDAAYRAALGVAKGYSRHYGTINWTLKAVSGRRITR